VCGQGLQFRVIDQIDFAEETDLDDLPDQTQHQVRGTINKILATNVDDVAANSFGRVDGDLLVLSHFVHVEVIALVEHTLINSVRNGVVDQFAQQQAIFHRGEQGHVLRVDRQSVSNVAILCFLFVSTKHDGRNCKQTLARATLIYGYTVLVTQMITR